MVRIKDASVIAKHYDDAISRVPALYKEGINSTTGFVDAAVGGQDVYVAQMSKPDVLARRASQLSKLSDADWKTPAMDKGAARIGPGMKAGEAKRTKNYGPIHAAIAAAVLPARTADYKTNMVRVEEMVRVMKEAAGKL